MLCIFRVFFGVGLLLSLLKNHGAYAAADFGTSAVLPKGRHQMVMRFGSTLNVQEKYSNSGSLEDISRLNIKMDSQFLKNSAIQSNNTEMLKLLEVLNSGVFSNEKLGDQLEPGNLYFEGSAQFNYWTPQLARGLTKNWTFGLAIPIVNFKSNVKAVDRPSENNTNAVFAKISTNLSAINSDLEMARAQFAQGPKALFEANREVAGYKAIEDKNLTFVGDIILGSIYRIVDTKNWELHLQNYLTLPTGPADDPDDLVDPSVFNNQNFETTLYNNINANSWLKLGVGAGYVWTFERTEEKRVPRFDGDLLPPKDTKETLKYDPGDAVVFKLHTQVIPIRDTELGLGYEKSIQYSDDYSGSRGQRYDLLEKNSRAQYDTLKMKASYTTVDSFISGDSKIPISFTYAFSDIIDGENIEREETHELLMKMYF